MKKILVIGSSNMDVIIEVKSSPLAGESIFSKKVSLACGGKGANQAVAAARLGGNIGFFTKVGSDEYGSRLLTAFEKDGVKVLQPAKGSRTGTAYIILEDNGQNRIIVDSGANYEYDEDELGLIDQVMDGYDIILLQLELPMDVIKKVIAMAASKKKFIIVDAGPKTSVPPETFADVDILSPNESELEALTHPISDKQQMLAAAQKLLDSGVKNVLLKLGHRGAYLFNGSEDYFASSYKAKAVDTTAAGDAFTAAVAVKLAEDDSPEGFRNAIDFACKVGALTVQKLGAQPSLPNLAEVNEFDLERNKYSL